MEKKDVLFSDFKNVLESMFDGCPDITGCSKTNKIVRLFEFHYGVPSFPFQQLKRKKTKTILQYLNTLHNMSIGDKSLKLTAGQITKIINSLWPKT